MSDKDYKPEDDEITIYIKNKGVVTLPVKE